MPFLDISSNKFRYLLSHGMHTGELKSFFAERYKMLVLKGARLRHPPTNRKDRIEYLATRLPRSTDEVVRQWFTANVTVELPLPVEELLEWFQVFNDDDDGGGLPADDAKSLARSALVHLFSNEVDQRLIDYLRKPPAGAEPPLNPQHAPNESPASVDDSLETPPSPQTVAPNLSSLLLAAVLGQDELLQDVISGLPPKVQTFVDGLLSAKNGNRVELETFIDELPEGSVERNALESLRTRASVERSPDRQGISVSSPAWLGGEEPERLEVLGVTTTETDSVVFVRPLALRCDDRWLRMTNDDRLRLFPYSGDVMVYRRSGKRVPTSGEYVQWVVEQREHASGKTTFHIAEELSRVYEVVDVGASSSEIDLVRESVLAIAAKRRLGQPTLFALADGVLLGPKSSDIIREDSFEVPWHVWNSAECMLIEGRVLHLDLPRSRPGPIDLTPPDLALKRVVRSYVESGKIGLTNRQVSELIELMRSDDLGLAEGRARRLKRDLDQISLDLESLGQLEEILLKRPEIHRRIDSFVDAEVRRRLEVKDSILTEIENARNRKDELDREVKNAEKRIRALQDETRGTVKRVFEESLSEGLRTLTQAAVFEELSSRTGAGSARTQGRPHARLICERVQNSHDAEMAMTLLRRLGVSRKASVGIVAAAKAATSAGFAFVLRGSLARPVARVVAKIESAHTMLIDVPLGFTDIVEFDAVIENAAAEGSVCVLNADAGPLATYGARLFDTLYDAAGGQIHGGRRLVLAFSSGEFMAELPGALGRVCLVCDTDMSIAEGSEDFADFDEAELPWLPGLGKKLKSYYATLQPEEQEQLSSVLCGQLGTP